MLPVNKNCFPSYFPNCICIANYKVADPPKEPDLMDD